MSTKRGNCDGCFADGVKVATLGNASICKRCLVNFGKEFGAKLPSTSDRDALLSENVALRDELNKTNDVLREIAFKGIDVPAAAGGGSHESFYKHQLFECIAAAARQLQPRYPLRRGYEGLSTPSEPEHGKGAGS